MKKIFLVLLVAGSLLAIKAVSKNLSHPVFPNIGSKAIVSIDSFEIKINSEDHPQIVDTRLPEEFAINHLINAININSLEKNYTEQISKLNKTKPVFAYAIGNGRSVELANELITKGFATVYVLNGGIGGWIGNGKPIYSSSKDNFGLNDLRAIISSNKIVLLDLHTRYCPGCRKLQPTVDSLRKNMVAL